MVKVYNCIDFPACTPLYSPELRYIVYRKNTIHSPILGKLYLVKKKLKRKRSLKKNISYKTRLPATPPLKSLKGVKFKYGKFLCSCIKYFLIFLNLRTDSTPLSLMIVMNWQSVALPTELFVIINYIFI